MIAHTCDIYSICWICYYVRTVCDQYLVLVRVHSQLVAISHSLHIICIFSFLYIVGGAYAYDLGPISSKFSLQK